VSPAAKVALLGQTVAENLFKDGKSDREDDRFNSIRLKLLVF
jgi:hypothetical protein